MSNRIKKSLALGITSRADAEAGVTRLAEVVNARRAFASAMDDEILAIRNRYELKLGQLDAQIEQTTGDLEAWAVANPSEFGKRKSIEFLNGTVGFRTGTPKLSLLSPAWTWEKVTAAVERLLPNFIRNKPEVDKESILGQRDELAEFLPSVGLKVTQGESFYVEPKLTEESLA